MSARNVLAIAAHPDDIEFLMAGTLVLLGSAVAGLLVVGRKRMKR